MKRYFVLHSRCRQEKGEIGSESTAGRRVGRALLFGLSLILISGATCHLAGIWHMARSRETFEAFVEEMVPLQRHLAGRTDPTTDPRLQPVLEATEMPTFDVGEATPWSRSRRDWTAEMLAKARLAVQLNEQQLTSLFALTTENPTFHLPPLQIEGSDFLTVLRMAYLLNLEAQLAFSEADTERGVQALQVQARIVTLLQENPAMVSALVSAVTAQLVDRVVMDLVRLSELWAADPMLLAALEGLVPEVPFESLMASSTREQVRFTKRLLVAKSPLAPRIRLSPLVRFLVSSWVVAEAYDVGRHVLEATARPLAGGLPADVSDSNWRNAFSWGNLPLGAFEQSRAFAFHFADRVTAELRDDTSVGPLERSLLYSAGKLQWSASRRQLTRAALVMRQIGLREGRYPPQRPDLPVLTDPVAFTGRRLAYSLLTDGSLRLGQGVSEDELMSLYMVAEEDERAKERILGSETLWVDLPPQR